MTISKFFEKPLDKIIKMLYNKDTTNEREEKNMEKMTQKKAIAYVLENFENKLPADVVGKLKDVQTSLEKKSISKGEKSLTPTQKANVSHKETILKSMERDRLYTISEMMKEFPFSEELSSQRVSALVKQLKDAQLIVRVEDKRKAYFKLA